MKSIKQIRENFDLITEKEEKEDRKLSTLVRAGLYDAKKLPALKKALDKSADKMTGQEKRMLLNLLDSLISQVTSDEQVYRKVKQNVHHVNEAKKDDTYSKFDSRVNQGFPTDKDMPSVLILKRKAIRVYPDNQKVALYYSQALDKYVTIPFNDVQTSLSEEQIEENVLGAIIKGAVSVGKYGKKILDASRAAGKTMAKSRYKRDLRKKVDDAVNTKRAERQKNTIDKLADRRLKGKRPTKPKKRRDGIDMDLDPTVVVGGGLGGFGGNGGSSRRSEMPDYKFGNINAKSVSSEPLINRGDTPVEIERASRLARQSQQAMMRQPVRENVLNTIKNMVNSEISEHVISIDEHEININNTVAKKIMLVYESVNSKNKKKMEKMLNESAASFNQVLTFALRQ